MADIILNPEKSGLTPPEATLFSPAQSEGHASASAFKVADSSAKILPVLVICPNGQVAGKAYDRGGIAKLNQQCRENG